MNLALDAAGAQQTILPAAKLVPENRQAAIDEVRAAKDWSVLARATRRRAGLTEDSA